MIRIKQRIVLFVLFNLVACSETPPKSSVVEPVAKPKVAKHHGSKEDDDSKGSLGEPDLNDPLWSKISEDDGINTFSMKAPDQDVVAFRGEATIPAPMKKVVTVLSDPNIRKEWVDALVETHTVEKKSDFESIEYNHTKVPWPFQDRDFVYQANVKVDQKLGAIQIKMKSVDDAREPPRSGLVRGEILHSAYWMKETKGKTPSTHIVIEMAVDPKGGIPLWMVNLTQKKWPHNTLLALKKLAMRPDLVVPKSIEDYFSTSKKTKGKI